MSRRTRDLPPLGGLPRVIRDLRYHEASRQGLGLLLMVAYAVLAEPKPAAFVVGAILALMGMAVRLYASGFIIKNKELATHGPYSLVRHPLYTGNLLLLIGFTFANSQLWAVLVSGTFWWFYYPPAIEYEDRKLRRIFGEKWEQWSQAVPAVIPARLLPSGALDWSVGTSLRQNAEPLVAVFILFWLVFIGRPL